MSVFQKYFPQVQYLKERNQAYLDNSATTLKPQCVIDTLNKFYSQKVSNVHRGDHYLSDALTLSYESVRTKVQQWIQAKSAEEIIFTKSTTEGINFLSHALENYFKPGDEILLTEMEHHSNILPWQALSKRRNLTLKFLPVYETGELDLEEWKKQVTQKTKLFAFTHYSNGLGTRNPVEKLCALAKEANILTVVDSAQALTAEPVNVQEIGCDFLVFSGHKLFAPTGVGALYAKKAHFNKLIPWQLGGGMVTDVNLSHYEPADPPQCFEAGTPPIEGVLALGSVLDFLNSLKVTNHLAENTGENAPKPAAENVAPENKPKSVLDNTPENELENAPENMTKNAPAPLRQNAKLFFEEIKKNKKALLTYTEEELRKIPGIKIIGSSPTKVNIVSFVLKSAHCRDMGQLISQAGVAIRSGHHCCLPLMKKLNLPSGTIRASFSIYNDEQDVKYLISAVHKAKKILG